MASVIDKSTFVFGVGEGIICKDVEAGNALALSMQTDAADDVRSQPKAEMTFVNHAKRKGKSKHRRQNWEQIHREGRSDGSITSARDSLTQRKVKLQGQKQGEAIFAETDAAPPADARRAHGIVTQLYPGGAMVKTEQYGQLMCGLAGTFRPAPNASALAVGDEVEIALRPETVGHIDGGDGQIDRDRVEALIEQRGPRRSALSRPQPMRGKWRDDYGSEVFEKVIAANLDQLVVVCAIAKPPLRRRLIDRFMIVAERGELDIRLIINKCDLGELDTELLCEFEPLGLSWVCCSAATGEGLDDVIELLRDKTSVLAGASGVGKSSLLNAINPKLKLATKEVRQKDRRGRHTTTTATMYDMEFGTVIDSPGIRELGIEIDTAELPWYFPEIAEYAPNCRFRDCTHTHEPGCEVIAAVEEEKIPPRRYESYLRILDSMGN